MVLPLPPDQSFSPLMSNISPGPYPAHPDTAKMIADQIERLRLGVPFTLDRGNHWSLVSAALPEYRVQEK